MANFEKDGVPVLSETHAQLPDELMNFNFRRPVSRTKSASISIPLVSMESHEKETRLKKGHTGTLCSERKTPFVQINSPLYATHGTGNLLQQTIVVTGKKVVECKTDKVTTFHGTGENHWSSNQDGENEHLRKSGILEMCDDPYCTTCPTYFKASQQRIPKASTIFDPKFHNALYGDAKGLGRKFLSFCFSHVPGVMNPHTKVVQQWNKFLAIFCLVAIFVDPLFLFLIYVQKDNKCIAISWTMTKTLVLLRSMNDFVYFTNILLQFRLAYVSPESRVVGAGDLVDDPKKIAVHYLKGYFLVDLFVVLPLPQNKLSMDMITYLRTSRQQGKKGFSTYENIRSNYLWLCYVLIKLLAMTSIVKYVQIMILAILPRHLGLSGANYAKNLLRAVILVQYIPRLFRILPLLNGRSPTGFIFESSWANFIINLLMFMLASHVVGSCWYLFGLQRVNQCLRDACRKSNINGCIRVIDCGHGRPGNYWSASRTLARWNNNTDAIACLNPSPSGFHYGIYVSAVPLTIETNMVNKYVYSLFWGLQQISTLAGALTPSYFVWEVLFTMAIIGLGLLLFALLIGNVQNFLQGLGRRRLEMLLRCRDVEQWMRHRRLPENLRRRVQQAERYKWAATRGVNEEMLIENLPEDLQIDIRRHLFKFVKKIQIFSLMDEPILDAICERLRQKTYINGSRILSQGGLVEKMVFVVRGKLESIGEDGIAVPLSEGDACGEELLTWYLEHSSVSKDGKKARLPGQRLLSNRTVKCLTNVEAFSLRAADLEEVTTLFMRSFRSLRVQGPLRYESPYWRSLAATRIQVVWRYWKKRQNRVDTSQSYQTLKS